MQCPSKRLVLLTFLVFIGLGVPCTAENVTTVPNIPIINQSLAAFDIFSDSEVEYVPPDSEYYAAAAEYQVFEACAGCSGPAALAKKVRVTTYPVITDPDLADPVYLGRGQGVKVDLFPEGDPDTLEGTLGSYEADATRIAGALFTGDLGTRTAFVAVFFREGTPDEHNARFILNAADAAKFGDTWDESSYIRFRDWTEASVSAEEIAGYEEPGGALETTGPVLALGEPQGGASCDQEELKQRMRETADDLAASVSSLTLSAGDENQNKVAVLALDLADAARSYAIEYEDLEVPASADGARADFVMALDAYQDAGSALWYGVTCANTTVYGEGATSLTEARDTMNGVLGALALQTLDDPTLELPSAEVYPDALAFGKGYSYLDSGKVHKISVRPESYTFTKSYKAGDEEVTAPYGKTFMMVLVDVNYLGFYGGGSSRAKVPAPQTFSLINGGETYAPATVSVPYIEGIGTVYRSVTIDRDDRRAIGFLVFEVPESFDPANAYLQAKLGVGGSPVWCLG
ncbi:hypothetical protein J2129_002431 [Methanofollis sp. W23]|uniref:hypothetical protein n=1 Tax=Methanofollis sp. W23 TaxID=2817849 RepID=UPI001AEA3142|nr:hypothetical protein [Methanofollis sp. W23]MBP2146977.1 hypothetical protein [Methanofollis sp. W23]